MSLPGRQTSIRESPTADIYVLGGGVVGEALTRRLQVAGHAVALLDESHAPDVSASPTDLSVHWADPTDVAALTEAGVAEASTVIVATGSDSQNLLIAQLVKVRFEVDRILLLTYNPERLPAIAEAGHEPVCATTALAEALAGHV